VAVRAPFHRRPRRRRARSADRRRSRCRGICGVAGSEAPHAPRYARVVLPPRRLPLSALYAPRCCELAAVCRPSYKRTRAHRENALLQQASRRGHAQDPGEGNKGGVEYNKIRRLHAAEGKRVSYPRNMGATARYSEQQSSRRSGWRAAFSRGAPAAVRSAERPASPFRIGKCR